MALTEVAVEHIACRMISYAFGIYDEKNDSRDYQISLQTICVSSSVADHGARTFEGKACTP